VSTEDSIVGAERADEEEVRDALSPLYIDNKGSK